MQKLQNRVKWVVKFNKFVYKNENVSFNKILTIIKYNVVQIKKKKFYKENQFLTDMRSLIQNSKFFV